MCAVWCTAANPLRLSQPSGTEWASYPTWSPILLFLEFPLTSKSLNLTLYLLNLWTAFRRTDNTILLKAHSSCGFEDAWIHPSVFLPALANPRFPLLALSPPPLHAAGHSFLFSFCIHDLSHLKPPTGFHVLKFPNFQIPDLFSVPELHDQLPLGRSLWCLRLVMGKT